MKELYSLRWGIEVNLSAIAHKSAYAQNIDMHAIETKSCKSGKFGELFGAWAKVIFTPAIRPAWRRS
jgi:hypothetical protein